MLFRPVDAHLEIYSVMPVYLLTSVGGYTNAYNYAVDYYHSSEIDEHQREY